MAKSPEEMAASMIANLPEKTGKSIDEWKKILAAAALAKHGEMVKHLKTEYGVSHGFANTIVHVYRNATEEKPDDPVAAQYSGKKEHLRPIYDAVVAHLPKLGKDIELAPRKAYVSLRRNKQFATVGPATNSAVEIGLCLKDTVATGRLKATKGPSMVSHAVRIGDPSELDAELLGWLKEAYEKG